MSEKNNMNHVKDISKSKLNIHWNINPLHNNKLPPLQDCRIKKNNIIFPIYTKLNNNEKKLKIKHNNLNMNNKIILNKDNQIILNNIKKMLYNDKYSKIVSVLDNNNSLDNDDSSDNDDNLDNSNSININWST